MDWRGFTHTLDPPPLSSAFGGTAMAGRPDIQTSGRLDIQTSDVRTSGRPEVWTSGRPNVRNSGRQDPTDAQQTSDRRPAEVQQTSDGRPTDVDPTDAHQTSDGRPRDPTPMDRILKNKISLTVLYKSKIWCVQFPSGVARGSSGATGGGRIS